MVGWLSSIFGRRRRRQRLETEGAIRAVLDAEGPEAAWRRARAALRADPEAVGLLHLAAHVLRVGGERRTAELFDRAADAPHDPQRLFELGSELLSEEQPEIAAVLLERALRFVPFDAVVRSELALAHARSGSPDKVLATLALHPCLADDPGALFEFGWASMLAGDLDAAAGALRELPGARSLRDKLALAIERARKHPPKDARGFYFVEHGAVLLDASGPLGGRYERAELTAADVARLVAEAADVLSLVPRTPRVCILDEADRALGEALAARLDVPLSTDERPGPAVVVVTRGSSLEEVERARYDRPGTIVFALHVDHRRGLTHAPELVGVFARELAPVEVGADAEPTGQPRAFAEERREGLWDRGRRVRAAYIPDAPLPL